MAPKAKVRAKAKARGKALARPAAAPGLRRRRPLRRPAALEEEEDGLGAWARGEILPLDRVSLDQPIPGSLLVCEEAVYFGAKVKVACQILKVEIDLEEKYLQVRPTGTDAEGILKVFTADLRPSGYTYAEPAATPWKRETGSSTPTEVG